MSWEQFIDLSQWIVIAAIAAAVINLSRRKR